MKTSIALILAASMAGCVVAPVAPVAVVEPIGVVVCDDGGEPVVGCYSALTGWYTVNGWDPYAPAPIGFVPLVNLNVGVGFGGGTVVHDTFINNAPAAVSHPAFVAPHPSFAAAHPGFMAGLRSAGRVAKASAKVAGKVAVATTARKH
jgi:hypothetical protein